MPSRIIVLGAGYTGRVILREAMARGTVVHATSRMPDSRLSNLPPDLRICFNLADPRTWENLPETVPMIWCFPAEPRSSVETFARIAFRLPRRLVVLGSTSAYRTQDTAGVDQEPDQMPWVDDRTPVDHAIARVQGEEYLREQVGAVVLRAAGIYGPGRNPLNWLRRGRISNLNRLVNLIHVVDLAALCLLALDHAPPGRSYVVSDGTPRRWSDINLVARDRWNVALPAAPERGAAGKRISPASIYAELGYRLQYPDLYDALDELERSPDPTT